LMKQTGLASIDQVRISGGGAKSLLWQQILADVFDSELVTVNSTEGAAYGAALLAGVGSGHWPSVDAACEDTIQITGYVCPNSEATHKYEEVYSLYRELYPALKPCFNRMVA